MKEITHTHTFTQLWLKAIHQQKIIKKRKRPKFSKLIMKNKKNILHRNNSLASNFVLIIILRIYISIYIYINCIIHTNTYIVRTTANSF